MDKELRKHLDNLIDQVHGLSLSFDEDSITACLLRHAVDSMCIVLELEDVNEFLEST